MENKQSDLRRGLIVFVGLAVLTAVEFALAVLTSLYALLLVTAAGESRSCGVVLHAYPPCICSRRT